MENLYKCTKDYQDTGFYVGEVMTAKEWSEAALSWTDSDGWKERDREFCRLSHYDNEQDLINFIQDIWQIKIEKVQEG